VVVKNSTNTETRRLRKKSHALGGEVSISGSKSRFFVPAVTSPQAPGKRHANLVNLADASGIIQNPFRQRCLAGVNVSRDTNVALKSESLMILLR
jgi:hypothetical protein